MSIDLKDIAEAIVLLGAAVGALIYLGKWPFNKAKEKRMKHKEAQNLIFDTIPWLVQSHKELSGDIKLIIGEVTPNHGTSIKDSINRIEKKVNRQEALVRAMNQADNRASFEIDMNGEMVWANQGFLELMGRTREELYGPKFRLFVNDAYKDEVMDKVHEAVQYKAEIPNLFFLFDDVVPGQTIPVDTHFIPVIDASNELTSYIVTLKRTDC